MADPGDGEIVVRNTAMSVDPYMRGRMSDRRSYVAPFEVGRALSGAAVGRVIASGSHRFSVGDWVIHELGWREIALVPDRGATAIDIEGVSPSAYLGVLGVTGLTAYVGLTEIAGITAGDVVFVSGAAGAVGSLAGQFARLLGASSVIGSAGTQHKVTYLTEELGFDAAFDYHDTPVDERLEEAAPRGIDVYFDNVGGEQLEAAIRHMRDFGRIAACGSISAYNATEPQPGPCTIGLITPRRITLRGFIVTDHMDKRSEYLERASGWVSNGDVTWRETTMHGIEHAVEAFVGIFGGNNIGKMIVTLGDADS